MSDFDIKFPWIRYGVGNKKDEIKEKMMELTSAVWSPFNGQDMAKVFIFCMAYAVAKGFKPNKPPGSGGSMPASAFKSEMRNFMKAVAITHENDLDIITKPKEVVKICEGYAYAGFLEVYDTIKNRDSTISASMIVDSILHEIETEHTSK